MHKSSQELQNSDYQSQLFFVKMLWIFDFVFIESYHFLKRALLQDFIFWNKVQFMTTFMQVYSRFYHSNIGIEPKDQEGKDRRRQLLCYVSLIRACNKVL